MKNNRARVITFVLITLAVLTAGFFAVVAMSTAVPEGSPTVEYGPMTPHDQAPNAGVELPMVNLDGHWSVENNGTRFIATVVDNTINIDIVTNNMSMTYWNGTFKTTEAKGETITSKIADPKLRVLSKAKEKEFIVGDNTLSFEFQGMGIKAVLVLNHE